MLLALVACGATGSTALSGGANPDLASVSAEDGVGSAKIDPQPVAATAPTLEGILAAPADDDSIQVGEKDGRIKRMHFEAFAGPTFDKHLSGAIWPALPGTLYFLVKVGEETRPDCREMEDPTCWKWLDPNLLKGVTMRAYVSTSRLDPLPDDPTRGLLVDTFYHQDFLLSEVQKDGYNLDLNPLDLKAGNHIILFLLNKKPEDFSLAPSAYYDTMVSSRGKGRHDLGRIEIVDTDLYEYPDRALIGPSPSPGRF
ncbi:MAG: hypothetical protein IT572_02255 [Deltaproteobacteria bacterium]|nr:hypothetical protein [Deltaproteobacteria bacterium]